MSEKSAIERIKELDAERESLFEQAKNDALKKATDAIADLNALGLNYQLTSGVAKTAKGGTAGAGHGGGAGRDAADRQSPGAGKTAPRR